MNLHLSQTYVRYVLGWFFESIEVFLLLLTSGGLLWRNVQSPPGIDFFLNGVALLFIAELDETMIGWVLLWAVMTTSTDLECETSRATQVAGIVHREICRAYYNYAYTDYAKLANLRWQRWQLSNTKDRTEAKRAQRTTG